MKIFKSINNNIVSAIDDDGHEVVVIGKGIGYKATEGAEIPHDKIDKIYIMSNPDNMGRLKALFTSLPAEYIALTDEILTYARAHLKKKLNENAYFTLADHINFAVMRFRQGMNFQNVLLSEVRRFYAQEYEIGLHALELMKLRLGVTMPEDEAASIALHIFNAEYDISISDAFHATKILNKVLEIVQEMTRYPVNEQNYYCERFITHLKFLTQRIVKHEYLPEGNDDFFELLSQKYPKEMRCSQEIAAYIETQYQYTLPREEISNLTIHIKRIGTQ